MSFGRAAIFFLSLLALCRGSDYAWCFLVQADVVHLARALTAAKSLRNVGTTGDIVFFVIGIRNVSCFAHAIVSVNVTVKHAEPLHTLLPPHFLEYVKREREGHRCSARVPQRGPGVDAWTWQQCTCCWIGQGGASSQHGCD